MCRIVTYIGREILLEDVLVRPSHSLVNQSKHALNQLCPTNGDGFGLGWYAKDISPEPALFKSVTPAWSNENLLHLSAKIKSGCFFAHVRAATTGGLSEVNCHPFTWKNWLFMHNGAISNFLKIKRHLRHNLGDAYYHWIKGETDTEHACALFIQNFEKLTNPTTSAIVKAIKVTLAELDDLVKQYAPGSVSHFNLAITDGTRVFVTRYTNIAKSPANTLYYSSGAKFEIKNGDDHMQKLGKSNGGVLVCSEPLDQASIEWHCVPENHMIVVEQDLTISLEKISPSDIG